MSLQIINLQTELNYLDSVNIFKIFSVLTWPHPWTHPSIQPPTHQTIHPPMGGEFFTDFKSLNGIEISWLVQVLLNFYWFWGSPMRGWWMDGWGWRSVWVCRQVSHACMHAHAHTCTCMHMHVKHDKHAKHGCLHVDGHLHFLYMYTCACMHVHACGDTPMPPDAPRYLPPTCPLPRATGSPKHQNAISPELIEIIQFCLKILYLWTLLNSYRL